MHAHAPSLLDQRGAPATMPGQLDRAHEAHLGEIGTRRVQETLHLVERVLNRAFVAHEVQTMNFDERRPSGAGLGPERPDRALVSVSQRRFEVTVAYDVAHALRSRRRIEVRALAGDDAALGVAAFVTQPRSHDDPHAGASPRRFHSVAPDEGRGHDDFGRDAEDGGKGMDFLARRRGHLIGGQRRGRQPARVDPAALQWRRQILGAGKCIAGEPLPELFVDERAAHQARRPEVLHAVQLQREHAPCRTTHDRLTHGRKARIGKCQSMISSAPVCAHAIGVGAGEHDAECGDRLTS